MKCSRCGEICKDNQAFCLKCGTPIQVVPDFNLYEAELASNVGELMEEDKMNSDTEDLDFLDDDVLDDFSTTKESTMEFVDLKNYSKNTSNTFDVDGTDFTDKKSVKTPKNSEKNKNEIQKEKNNTKIKAIIFAMILVIIIAGVVAYFVIYDKKANSNSSFENKYKLGEEYYGNKNYDNALTTFKEAENLANSKSEKIKVAKYILSCYEQMDDRDAEKIDVLKKLIKLSPKTQEYYEKLIEIYDSLGMNDSIAELIDGIKDSSIKTALAEYTTSAPTLSYESGTYTEEISIKLTSDSKNTIYYTTDGNEPTNQSQVYTSEIKLSYDGDYVIKAIAYNEKGAASKVVTGNYTIALSAIAAPEVSPSDSEQYDTEQQITVTVPEGMTCYYTYGEEAVTPTTSDTQYTGPIEMLRGNNNFEAILVSKNGTVSDVTHKFYSLNRVYDYDASLKMLRNYMVESLNCSVVSDTQVAGNDSTYDIDYEAIEFIDSKEYWIFRVTKKDAAGTVNNIIYYGIDTVSGIKDGAPAILIQSPENADQYNILTEVTQ